MGFAGRAYRVCCEARTGSSLLAAKKPRGRVAAAADRQPWDGTEFHVRVPDGEVISFVTYG
jgi:hypothetical protein